MELRDDGMCFVCGKKNAAGLQLDFQLDGESLRTKFTPQKKHQGYADITHGGIISLILDEMLINLPWVLGKKAVTAEFTVRLKQPVKINEELFFTSNIMKEHGRLLLIQAEAKKKDGSVVATATGKGMRIK